MIHGLVTKSCIAQSICYKNNMTARERVFRSLKAFAQGFFIGVPVCLTVTDNFCTVCQVEGVSMQPVLNPDTWSKDFVLINRWKAKRFERIQRGDIVSIVSPKDPATLFIKRIVALEGDKIRTLNYKNRIVRIPRGHCWIEGDNRKHSLDSNCFGSVPLGLVNGVATRVIWPPSRWGELSNQLPKGRNPFDITTEEHSGDDDVISDVIDDVIDKVMNDVDDCVTCDVGSDSIDINDIPTTTSNSNTDVLDVDLKAWHDKTKSELTGSSSVLTNLPQNARGHASDIESDKAQIN